jgi:hypothetical protein
MYGEGARVSMRVRVKSEEETDGVSVVEGERGEIARRASGAIGTKACEWVSWHGGLSDLISLFASFSQSMSLKKGWLITACLPPGPHPSLVFGLRSSS